MYMLQKILLFTTILSGNCVSAAVFNADNFIDNGTYTTDKVSGLDWLDLTATQGRSYNDVTNNMGAGEEYYGWEVANTADLTGWYNNFGGDATHYDGWSEENDGIFYLIAAYWGDLYADVNGLEDGDGHSWIIHDGALSLATRTTVSLIGESADKSVNTGEDLIMLTATAARLDNHHNSQLTGIALIRSTQSVPEPSSLFLISLGLIGCFRSGRRIAFLK